MKCHYITLLDLRPRSNKDGKHMHMGGDGVVLKEEGRQFLPPAHLLRNAAFAIYSESVHSDLQSNLRKSIAPHPQPLRF